MNQENQETARQKLGNLLRDLCEKNSFKGISHEKINLFSEGLVVPTKEEINIIRNAVRNDTSRQLFFELIKKSLKEQLNLFPLLLKRYRDKKNLSQPQLAKKSGITQTAISQLERNRHARKVMIMKDASALAKALGLNFKQEAEFISAAFARIRLEENLTFSKAPTEKRDRAPSHNPADKPAPPPKENASDPVNKTIGLFLKKIREQKKLSTQLVEKTTAIPSSRISEIEQGEKIVFAHMIELARALNLSEGEERTLANLFALKGKPISVKISKPELLTENVIFGIIHGLTQK